MQAHKSKGDYDRALHFYEKDLAIKLATIGESHPETAKTFYAMGQVHSCKDDYDRASTFSSSREEEKVGPSLLDSL